MSIPSPNNSVQVSPSIIIDSFMNVSGTCFAVPTCDSFTSVSQHFCLDLLIYAVHIVASSSLPL